jgi:tetratricopeptide (TPR) repeat protein
VTVLILEEHSSVLPEWWSRGLRARTLIYLDAHLDLQYVSPKRLGDLEQCTTVQAVKRLEKTHHLLPDRNFSYSLEDFLYPAHRLGMIERLIWVAPPHVQQGYSRAILDRLQQMDGVQMDDLASFRKAADGWIEGRLLGLAIAVCNYRQLESMALPADTLIDIDTDYFVTVPGDEVWVNPRDVFEALSRLPVKPELITVSRSVSSGFMPLRYRFFADYLAALLEKRHQDAAHYEQVFRLACQLRSEDVAAVRAGCKRELQDHPRCAATHYLLSLSEQDPEQAAEHQRQAEELCSGYRPDVLRSACEIPNRRLPVGLQAMCALEERLTEVRDTAEKLALAQIALGLIYCVGGQVARACALYQQGAQQLQHHPELALEIGKRLLGSDGAEGFLTAALLDDKTRAAAHVFLAHFHANRGSLLHAVEHLEAAHEMTPAWLQVLSMLAELHRRLGNQQRAQTLLTQYGHQRHQTELLAQSLAPEGRGCVREE